MNENIILPLVTFIIGLVVGVLIAFVLRLIQNQNARELVQSLFSESQQQIKENEQLVLCQCQIREMRSDMVQVDE